MPELLEDSAESAKSTIAHASDLLTYYSFDLDNHTVTQLLDRWLQDYPASWVRLAVIEALFQGRYKAISVSQILQFWQRRDQPLHRFSYEFERLVCNKFPRNLNQSDSAPPPLITRPQPAVLPLLPTAAHITGNPYRPAWTALAAQIQQESTEPLAPPPIAADSADPNPPIAPSPPASTAPRPVDQTPEPPSVGTAAQLMPPAGPLEVSAPTRYGIQANVAALIEQASSDLNASAESMKTKLRPATPEVQPLPALTNLLATLGQPIATDSIVTLPLPNGAAPVPPPPADFHAKLKAVAEQQVEK